MDSSHSKDGEFNGNLKEKSNSVHLQSFSSDEFVLHTNAYDRILDKIGGLGCYQWLHIVILALSTVPTAMFNLGNALLAAVPDYKCTTSEEEHGNLSYVTIATPSNSSPAFNTDEDLQLFPAEPCQILTNWTSDNVTQCPKWIYNTDVFGTTIVTEWDFVCSREWLASLSQTTYMIGFLFGGIWAGAVSDRFGRRMCWLINLILMTLSGSVCSLMTNYWAFIGVRAVSAAGSTAVIISSFVLMTENIGPKHRLKFSMLYHLAFTVGSLLLAVAGYLFKNFRHLQLFMGLLPIASIPLFWVIDESGRWLLAEGKYDQARTVIQRAAKMNKTQYPDQLISEETERLLKEDNIESDVKGTVLDLVRTPNMRFKIIVISYGWFLCTLLYYGLSLGASNFVGGPFLNLFLNGLIEFPGIILCTVLLDKIGRKLVFGGSLICSSLCCLLMAVVPYEFPIALTTFSVLGKLFISGSFATVYVYTAEIFPTVVRTLAVGTGSMCSRVAGILSPNIALLTNYWTVLPYIVFGLLTLVGGILSFLLPETLNQTLPESLEDGEQFGKGSYKRICEFPLSKHYDNNNTKNFPEKSTISMTCKS